MRKRAWRRRIAVVGLLVLVASVVGGGTAQAGEPLRFTDHRITLECGPLENETGVLVLFVESSEVFGAHADLAFWPTGTEPFEDPPSVFADFEATQTVSATDSAVSAEVPLINQAGDPQGSASIAATLTPLGGPEPVEDFREGNMWVRQEGTVQNLAVAGTAILPGGNEFSLDSCFANILDVTVFQTNPNTFVEQHAGIHVDCVIESESGFLTLFATDEERPPFAFVALDSAAEGLRVGDAAVTLTKRELSGTVPLHDESGEDAGAAVIDATLTPGERVSFSTQAQNARIKQSGRLYDVTGTVTFQPGGEQFALSPETCLAIDTHDTFAGHNPKGPKPGGKAPVNDAPESALPLAIGSRVTQQTGGAAEAPERECATEEFGAPLGRTVWYSVTGTGGPVTIDTDGSNFDTVIGVYTDTLEPLECVDDISPDRIGFSLQSLVTLEDTEPGATYLVQIGGFAAEFGTLKVAVS